MVKWQFKPFSFGPRIAIRLTVKNSFVNEREDRDLVVKFILFGAISLAIAFTSNFALATKTSTCPSNLLNSKLWEPFFRPKVSIEELEGLNQGSGARILVGEGGQGRVEAVLESGSGVVYAEKRFSEETAAKNEFNTLLAAKTVLENTGLIAPFKVANIKSRAGRRMRLQLVEGLSLKDLQMKEGLDPVRGDELMDSYRLNLQIVVDRLNRHGVKAEWITGRESLGKKDPTYGLEITFEHKKTKRILAIYWDNVIVDYKTGQFVIVDSE